MPFSDRANIRQFLDEVSRTPLLALAEEIACGIAVAFLKSIFDRIDIADFAYFLIVMMLVIATLPMKTPRNIFVWFLQLRLCLMISLCWLFWAHAKSYWAFRCLNV